MKHYRKNGYKNIFYFAIKIGIFLVFGTRFSKALRKHKHEFRKENIRPFAFIPTKVCNLHNSAFKRKTV